MTAFPFGLNLSALNIANFINTPVLLRARAIGNIIADITISERHLDTLAITDHPVERGAAISDHCFMLPYEVMIQVGWSNSSRNSGGDPTYIITMYQLLLALQQKRMPFDILTGKRWYKNMLLHRVLTETNETTENSLLVTAECRQVIIVGTQIISNNGANNSITGGTQNNGAVSPGLSQINQGLATGAGPESAGNQPG